MEARSTGSPALDLAPGLPPHPCAAPPSSAPIGPASERELFNLDTDPYTETDIITDSPDIAADLHAKLIEWLRDLDAPDEAVDVYL